MERVGGRWQALGCALLLVLCILVSRPYAEIGVNDDWSYIRTAQLYAQTGHVVFNGWATAALGWQVWLGALCIKLFGFSFTAVRMSMVPVAVATAFLLHRLLVRFGATDWNATVATLALMVSPLMLPLSATFHTDLPAFACIVLSGYACARMLRAGSLHSAALWLVFASLVGDMGGINRQIAWLSALAMVPATVWVSRQRKQLWPLGVALFLFTAIVIAGTLHWLAIHPHTVPEKPLEGHLNSLALHNLLQEVERNLVSLPFYLFPLCIAFLPRFPYRRLHAWAGTSVVALWLGQLTLRKLHQGSFHFWLTPASTGVISLYGAFFWGSTGHWPVLLNLPLQIGLTAATWFTALAVGGVLTAAKLDGPVQERAGSSNTLSSREVCWLLLPFAALYFAALLPRAAFFLMMDRYLLPLYLCAAIGLIRFYQRRVALELPRLSFIAALVMAALGTAMLHDLFAAQRGKLQAANEVLASGLPRAALSAGFEYDNWTQLLQTGYVTDYRVAKRAPGDLAAKVLVPGAKCQLPFAFLNPSLQPRYFLSYDPDSCAGPAPFAPVTYGTWLNGPQTIYVLRAGEPPDGLIAKSVPSEAF